MLRTRLSLASPARRGRDPFQALCWLSSLRRRRNDGQSNMPKGVGLGPWGAGLGTSTLAPGSVAECVDRRKPVRRDGGLRRRGGNRQHCFPRERGHWRRHYYQVSLRLLRSLTVRNRRIGKYMILLLLIEVAIHTRGVVHSSVLGIIRCPHHLVNDPRLGSSLWLP